MPTPKTTNYSKTCGKFVCTTKVLFYTGTILPDTVQTAFDAPPRSVFPLILTLDTHGVPHRWITWQHACYYYSKDQVAWSLGEYAFTVHGGLNRVTGERSHITSNSIIAIKGRAMAMKAFGQVPPLNNRELFHRDRQICAYC
ncbi:MAG: hypothetical protein ACSLFK_08285, partial [Gemmatimonadaceae bacterium]